MVTYKSVVEVASAHGLSPKYGKGSASACVDLKFDGQRLCTAIKEKTLDPVWNERFCFDVSYPSRLHELALDAYVYNVGKSNDGSRSFDLGKVRINGTSFVPVHYAVFMNHVLKKCRMRSHAKGTLALRIYIITSHPFGPIGSSFNTLESILQDQSSKPRSMPLQYLKEITNNFSRERILGQGGVGVVYKGVLQNGEMIAVKKIISTLMPGLQEQFENEVYHLMTLKHPNIVRRVDYCYEIQNVCLEYNGKYVFAEQAESLICLEYLPKGSLNSHLSDESSWLDWSTRYKTIKGVCNGLSHLHEQIDNPMIHLDLKHANILIDNSMEPKITDFGLARVLDQQTIRTTSRDGTFGYMAPEFLHGGTITLKSDIFSLGVIILEIITGRRDYPNIGTSSDDFIQLVSKSWSTFQDKGSFSKRRCCIVHNIRI